MIDNFQLDFQNQQFTLCDIRQIKIFRLVTESNGHSVVV